MDDFFSFDLLTATLRFSAPLIFAAMGGLLCERAGVMNIALEGFMLVGAFAAAAGTYYAETPFAGLVAGMAAAMLAATIHAFWCVTLRGDQIVAGTAINLLGVGIPAFLLQRIWGTPGGSPQVERLPGIGAGLNVLVPVALVLVPIVHYVVYQTRAGLRIQAAGEHPRAAASVGIDVVRYRYACVIASGALAGLGGAYLSIGDLSQYTNNMAAGRGFIAIAAVIFGNWTPFGTLGATLLFGAAQATRVQVQALGLNVAPDLIGALPYLLTLIVITGLVRRSDPPAGLGKHATAE